MSEFHEFSASRLMPVPVAAVWEFTEDPRHNAQWCNNVREVTQVDRPFGIGRSFEEISVVAGPLTSVTTWTLRTVVAQRERTFTGKGFPGVGEIRPFVRMEPVTDAAGAELAYVTYGSSIELSYGRFIPVVTRLLRRMLATEFTTSLANLEKLAGRHAARNADRF
ncbi:SRPBCC family protein [Nocardia sp. NPDC060259]|uniref:SRPBCC family protein n=1 Tax=Nocardia sp. NPDC060259 TaxID=3347088 RepID=UPI00364CC7A7